MPAQKPKKGSKVRVIVKLEGYEPDHIFTVAENAVGLPAPYKLDDHKDDNPYLVGPFKADELAVVKR